jgi:hypothetical protein
MVSFFINLVTRYAKPATIFVLILSISVTLTSCFESEVEKIDHAIAELQKANRTFEDIKNILDGLKKNLDNGVYKDQVDDLIGRTGQVAQLSAEGSVDFVRTRVIEDLQNLKAKVSGQPAPPRVPILSNAQSPKIDYTSISRSTLTIVGWNLDVAQADPGKYKVVIKNNNEADRDIDRRFITYQGQYAVTMDTSTSGIPFRYYDTKLVFEGFNPLFELAVINTNPPPDPEYFTELFIESHQEQDEKDLNIKPHFRVLFDSNPYIEFDIGKGNTWENPGTVMIKIWKENQNNRLGFFDAINKYGPVGYLSHRSEIDQDCGYLVVQPNLNHLIKGSGKKGTFLVEEREDNSGWNCHFTLRGKTNKGTNVVLLTTNNLWFGDGHSNSYQSEFTW